MGKRSGAERERDEDRQRKRDDTFALVNAHTSAPPDISKVSRLLPLKQFQREIQRETEKDRQTDRQDRDDAYALGNAHMRSIRSLKGFPFVAFRTVPLRGTDRQTEKEREGKLYHNQQARNGKQYKNNNI